MSLNATAVELLNCLALRKLLFINILSSYAFFLKCLIQQLSQFMWISLQTELLMRKEDVLLFNIERLELEDRPKKGVAQYTNAILLTCYHLMHELISEIKCLHFLSRWDSTEDVSGLLHHWSQVSLQCQHPSAVVCTHTCYLAVQILAGEQKWK